MAGISRCKHGHGDYRGLKAKLCVQKEIAQKLGPGAHLQLRPHGFRVYLLQLLEHGRVQVLALQHRTTSARPAHQAAPDTNRMQGTMVTLHESHTHCSQETCVWRLMLLSMHTVSRPGTSSCLCRSRCGLQYGDEHPAKWVQVCLVAAGFDMVAHACLLFEHGLQLPPELRVAEHPVEGLLVAHVFRQVLGTWSPASSRPASASPACRWRTWACPLHPSGGGGCAPPAQMKMSTAGA